MNILSVSKAINSDQEFVLSIFLDVEPYNKTTKQGVINVSNISCWEMENAMIQTVKNILSSLGFVIGAKLDTNGMIYVRHVLTWTAWILLKLHAKNVSQDTIYLTKIECVYKKMNKTVKTNLLKCVIPAYKTNS